MSEKEFKLDTTFTGSTKSYARPLAVVAAIVGVAIIVLSLTTDFPSRLLPMDENYLAVLIPKASDGGNPLALTALDHTTVGDSVVVVGTVENRTDTEITDLLAIIESADLQGMPAPSLEIVLTPAIIPAHESGRFEATLSGKSARLVVKFRLADGPLVPHDTAYSR